MVRVAWFSFAAMLVACGSTPVEFDATTVGSTGSATGVLDAGGDVSYTGDADATSMTTPHDDDGQGSDDANHDGVAMLELTSADVGIVTLGSSTDFELTISNVGTAVATNIQLALPLQPPFSFPGGVYPGEAGSCTSTLDVRASCTIVVRFAPDAPVWLQRDLTLTYDVGDGSVGIVEGTLRGGGQTDNLVRNPGAESNTALEHSTVENGAWTSQCQHIAPFEGDRCFFAGLASNEQFSHLVQIVDVSQWAASFDGASVMLHLNAHARSREPDWGDDFRVRVYVDGGNPVIDSDWQLEYEWTPVTGSAALPNGTTQVRLRLSCRKPSGADFCDAYFDALELVLRPAE